MPAGNAISVPSVEAAVPAATIGFRRRPACVRLRRGKHVRHSDGLVPVSLPLQVRLKAMGDRGL